MMVDTASVSVIVVYPIIIPMIRWETSATTTAAAAAAMSKYDTSNTYSHQNQNNLRNI